MSVLLVTRFSINILIVFKFRCHKRWTFHKWLQLRIVAIFVTADNNLCTRFLSATLNVSRILFIVVKPRAKGIFFYFTLHNILISATSFRLVNNNISSPIYESWFYSHQGQGNFPFSKFTGPAVSVTKLPFQSVSVPVFLGLQRRRQDGHRISSFISG